MKKKTHGDGSFAVPKSETVAKPVKKKRSSGRAAVLGEKLRDYCAELLQKQFKETDLLKLWQQSEDELHHVFLEKNLFGNDPDKKKIREYMIRERVMQKMGIGDKLEISLDLKEFLVNIGSETLKALVSENKQYRVSFNRTIQTLRKMQNDSKYVWSVEVPEEDYSKIVKRSIEAFRIPRIEYEFTDEGRKKFVDIDDLLSSRAKNKVNYIRRVIIVFDGKAIAEHIMPLSQYAVLNRIERQRYENHYTFRLDEIIRGYIWESLTYGRPIVFSAKELQQMFGVDFQNSRHFVKFVIQPAVNEFNQKTLDIKIEYQVIGRGNEAKIEFRIINEVSDRKYLGVASFSAYLLACLTANKMRNPTEVDPHNPLFVEYARYIDETLLQRKDDEVIEELGGRKITAGEWKETASAEYRDHCKIGNLVETNRGLLDIFGIEYSIEKLRLVYSENQNDFELLGQKIDRPSKVLRFLNDIGGGSKRMDSALLSEKGGAEK